MVDVDPNIKYGVGFGTSTGVDSSLADLEAKEQLQKLGWSHACTDPKKVVKEFGMDWAVNRYAECNFWHGYILGRAKIINPELYGQLISAIPRSAGEPVGSYDSQAVPPSHQTQMSPMSTPWGYALSRVLIEQFGRGKNRQERTPQRTDTGLQLLDQALEDSPDPVNFLVRLSEAVVQADADPLAVLGHVLSVEVFQEANCVTLYTAIRERIKQSAPTLWTAYQKWQQFPEDQQKQYGIASF